MTFYDMDFANILYLSGSPTQHESSPDSPQQHVPPAFPAFNAGLPFECISSSPYLGYSPIPNFGSIQPAPFSPHSMSLTTESSKSQRIAKEIRMICSHPQIGPHDPSFPHRIGQMIRSHLPQHQVSDEVKKLSFQVNDPDWEPSDEDDAESTPLVAEPLNLPPILSSVAVADVNANRSGADRTYTLLDPEGAPFPKTYHTKKLQDVIQPSYDHFGQVNSQHVTAAEHPGPAFKQIRQAVEEHNSSPQATLVRSIINPQSRTMNLTTLPLSSQTGSSKFTEGSRHTSTSIGSVSSYGTRNTGYTPATSIGSVKAFELVKEAHKLNSTGEKAMSNSGDKTTTQNVVKEVQSEGVAQEDDVTPQRPKKKNRHRTRAQVAASRRRRREREEEEQNEQEAIRNEQAKQDEAVAQNAKAEDEGVGVGDDTKTVPGVAKHKRKDSLDPSPGDGDVSKKAPLSGTSPEPSPQLQPSFQNSNQNSENDAQNGNRNRTAKKKRRKNKNKKTIEANKMPESSASLEAHTPTTSQSYSSSPTADELPQIVQHTETSEESLGPSSSGNSYRLSTSNLGSFASESIATPTKQRAASIRTLTPRSTSPNSPPPSLVYKQTFQRPLGFSGEFFVNYPAPSKDHLLPERGPGEHRSVFEHLKKTTEPGVPTMPFKNPSFTFSGDLTTAMPVSEPESAGFKTPEAISETLLADDTISPVACSESTSLLDASGEGTLNTSLERIALPSLEVGMETHIGAAEPFTIEIPISSIKQPSPLTRHFMLRRSPLYSHEQFLKQLPAVRKARGKAGANVRQPVPTTSVQSELLPVVLINTVEMFAPQSSRGLQYSLFSSLTEPDPNHSLVSFRNCHHDVLEKLHKVIQHRIIQHRITSSLEPFHGSIRNKKFQLTRKSSEVVPVIKHATKITRAPEFVFGAACPSYFTKYDIATFFTPHRAYHVYTMVNDGISLFESQVYLDVSPLLVKGGPNFEMQDPLDDVLDISNLVEVEKLYNNEKDFTTTLEEDLEGSDCDSYEVFEFEPPTLTTCRPLTLEETRPVTVDLEADPPQLELSGPITLQETVPSAPHNKLSQDSGRKPTLSKIITPKTTPVLTYSPIITVADVPPTYLKRFSKVKPAETANSSKLRTLASVSLA